METFSALLAICAGNSPVPGEFPTQRPVTRSFDVFFDQRSNKRLSKHWRGWWFETQSCPLWRHRNGLRIHAFLVVYGLICSSLSQRLQLNTKNVQRKFKQSDGYHGRKCIRKYHHSKFVHPTNFFTNRFHSILSKLKTTLHNIHCISIAILRPQRNFILIILKLVL